MPIIIMGMMRLLVTGSDHHHQSASSSFAGYLPKVYLVAIQMLIQESYHMFTVQMISVLNLPVTFVVGKLPYGKLPVSFTLSRMLLTLF